MPINENDIVKAKSSDVLSFCNITLNLSDIELIFDITDLVSNISTDRSLVGWGVVPHPRREMDRGNKQPGPCRGREKAYCEVLTLAYGHPLSDRVSSEYADLRATEHGKS